MSSQSKMLYGLSNFGNRRTKYWRFSVNSTKMVNKSGAYKKDRLNENFLKKVNKDVDINKTIADYEESKKFNLEFRMRNFLYNVCRKDPRIVEIP